MIIYALSGYLSPAESPPSFVIPTFTMHGSNEIFAQDLDQSGKIKRFLKIDQRQFYAVQEIPIIATKGQGEQGLLAYWKEEGGVLIAEYNNLSELLAGYMTSDPFADLEIAALTDNDERRFAAVDAIVELFSDRQIAQEWRTQEVVAAGKGFSKASLDRPDNDQQAGELDRKIDRLLADPENDKWAENWSLLWQSGYRQPELEEIALWWTDLGPGKGEKASQVYWTLIRSGRDTRTWQYTYDWLSRNDISVGLWSAIWNAAQGKAQGKDRDRLVVLAEQKLDRSIDTMNRPSQTWCILWYYLWQHRRDRSPCMALAAKAWKKAGATTRAYADFVIDPALTDSNCPDDVLEAASYWLQNDMRSVTLWAEIWLKTDSKTNSPALDRIAEYWLSYYGGNMNLWREVWIKLSKRIDSEKSFSLAKSWLSRARWDLSSWPKIYNDLAQNKEFKNNIPYLISLGNSWQSYQGAYPANAMKIDKAMAYFSSMSTTT